MPYDRTRSPELLMHVLFRLFASLFSPLSLPLFHVFHCRSKSNNNFLLTEREGRTGEYCPRSWQYGPSAASSVQKRPRANIPQYGPEQVKLVSSLLYGIIFRTKQHFW